MDGAFLSGILLPRLRLLAALSPHEATLEHGESRGVNDVALCAACGNPSRAPALTMRA